MGLIDWKDKYSVKIDSIDSQHKKLLDVLNVLSESMKKGTAKEKLTSIISDLVNYTKEHFKYEEDLMVKFSYSDIDSHKKEHEKFIDEISKFQDDFNAGKVLLSVKLLNFLANWIQNHIAGTDKKYIDFFVEKGVN